MDRDPEVSRLLEATRSLTGQAHDLSNKINEMMADLEEFVAQVNYNRQHYQGPERRREPR